jgi:hypothetical protein
MTRIEWGLSSERFYETGIDRAVLYVENEEPVSWNGLTSITNESLDGETTSFYYDAFKYINNVSKEDFKFVIKALYTPNEFNSCNGVTQLYKTVSGQQIQLTGLFITNQPQSKFNLTYRTNIESEFSGNNTGYKIYLIYNAKTVTSNNDYKTTSNNSTLNVKSFNISTTPQKINGKLKSPYLVINTKQHPSEKIVQLENILYGTATTNPRFPTYTEVMTLIGE